MVISRETYMKILNIYANGFYWVCLSCLWAALDTDTHELAGGATCPNCKRKCVNRIQFFNMLNDHQVKRIVKTGFMAW